MKKIKSLIIVIVILFIQINIYGQEIFDAVKNNDLAKVNELIKNDSSFVYLKDANGRIPLHWAARGVHFEVIKYLVENGAGVNVKDNNNITPLASVVSRNHIQAAEYLITKGADINAAANSNDTPLHYAASGGMVDMVRLLLKFNAELETRNNYGRTPLVLAAREAGNLEVIKLLVEKGADINSEDNDLRTALILSAWRGYENVVNYLIDKKAKIPVSGELGEILFEYALNKRLFKLYEAFLAGGGDSEMLNKKGTTALHIGAKGGSKLIVEDLLKRKFNVNGADVYGFTPLHYAAKNGRSEVITLLIENGANINAKSKVEETPYNLAVKAGKNEIANQLLSAGADSKKPVYTKLQREYFGMKDPGNLPEAFAVGIASNFVGGHSNITFSPDGREAFWTEWNEKETGYSDGCSILYSKIENGFWTVPKIFDAHGDTPIYAADGSGLYYLALSPKREIVFVEKSDDAYLPPKPVEFDLEQSRLYWQFSLDKNSNIYFAADDGLYRALFENGKYSAPEKLSEIFHPDLHGMHPYVSPDGDYLLFSAEGEYGNYDIYISCKKSDGKWTQPINLGNKINSSGNELFPIVSGDGKYLFFGSGRSSYGGKCWVSATFIEELRPN
jgi:ankyrin repeat protein